MNFTRCKLPQLPEIRLEDADQDDKVVVYVGRHSQIFDREAVTQIFENCGLMNAEGDTYRFLMKEHTISIVNALCRLDHLGDQPYNPWTNNKPL